MRIPGLEKRLGKLQLHQLPLVIQRQMEEVTQRADVLLELKKKSVTRSGYIGPEEAEKIKKQNAELEKANDKLRKLVRDNLHHAEIARVIAKGATHFHFVPGAGELHFVQLGAKHLNKIYAPITGNARIPIHVTETYMAGL